MASEEQFCAKCDRPLVTNNNYWVFCSGCNMFEVLCSCPLLQNKHENTEVINIGPPITGIPN